LPVMANFLIVLVSHWIADFVFQTHWQASNKSKNWFALSKHVINYSIAMTVTAALIWPWALLIFFFLITFSTHFITDAITSRITSKLYAKQDYHNFFVVIGFDQLIHQVTLAATIWYLYG